MYLLPAADYQEFDRLRVQIEAGLGNGRGKTLLVTSCMDAEGKTAAATHLACNVAKRGGRRVLLVDLNHRHPDVHNRLGIADGPGVGEILRDRCDWSALVHHLWGGPDVLLAGGAPGTVRDLVPAYLQLQSRLSWRYQLILVDGPPVLQINRHNLDAVWLAAAADWTLLVVRPRQTTRPQIRACKRILQSAGVTQVAAIVNGKPPVGADRPQPLLPSVRRLLGRFRRRRYARPILVSGEV
ncbi:MAG: CpsD/CapB family tyrosine-protein kinase [Candidatus Krumholzibacteriia bacterium]